MNTVTLDVSSDVTSDVTTVGELRKKINTLLESLNNLTDNQQVFIGFTDNYGNQFKTEFNIELVRDNNNNNNNNNNSLVTFSNSDIWKYETVDHRDIDFYVILKK